MSTMDSVKTHVHSSLCEVILLTPLQRWFVYVGIFYRHESNYLSLQASDVYNNDITMYMVPCACILYNYMCIY